MCSFSNYKFVLLMILVSCMGLKGLEAFFFLRDLIDNLRKDR